MIECTSTGKGDHYSVIKGVLYRSDDATFVYQVINKTKPSITIFKNKVPETFRSLEV